MHIVVAVNQQEAIRRGHNASSTVKLDVDVSSLDQIERDWIAARFVDGTLRHNGTPHGTQITIPVPTLAGLLETIRADIAQELVERDEAEQLARETMSAPPKTIRHTVGLLDSGEIISSTQDGRCVEISYPWQDLHLRHIANDMLSADTRELLDAWRTEAARRNEEAKRAAYESARPALEALRDKRELEQNAKRAVEAARDAARAAQIAQAAARAGGLTAEKHAAGYLSPSEGEKLVAQEELAARGVIYTGGLAAWGYSDADEWEDGLTDEQFGRLRDWRAKLPADAVVTIYQMLGRHHAEDDCLLVAEARWTVGQIEVQADVALDDVNP